MKNQITTLLSLLLLQAFIPTALAAQSVIGHWKLVEYSYWSAFPDSQYEAAIGDYLEINEDGTYYMRYSSNQEDWGQWTQNDDKLFFSVSKSTDDSFSLPDELKILQLTDDILEWELDYGILRFYEKYQRVDQPKEELKIGDETVETVRQRCEELKAMADNLFKQTFKTYTLTNDAGKVISEEYSFVLKVFQLFEDELDAYENGDFSLKETLEIQWNELKQLDSTLSQMLSFLFRCTITANEGGFVRCDGIEVRNETKTFWWLDLKAASNFHDTLQSFNVGSVYYGYAPTIEIIPFENYHVLYVTKNGKDITNNYDYSSAEGDIVVEFAEDSSSGISTNKPSQELSSKKYSLDGKRIPSKGNIPGIIIKNGRKYTIKPRL